MKRFKNFKEWDFYCLKKTFRIMRIIIFILITTLLQAFATETYSQKTKLSLDFTGAKLTDVLDEIENRTEFFFLFNEKLVDTNRKVSISVKDEKIEEILKELFAGTDVVYTIGDRKIILAPEYLSENQQQKAVSGKVTNTAGEPLPGVTVLVKGTTQGTVTNADGNYTLSGIPENAILVFSYIGFETMEVPVEGKTVIDVVLKEKVETLSDVVVVGYGTRKKETLTGSIAKIDGKDIKLSPAPNLTNSLGGRIPGIVSVSYSGQPGRDGNKILIRGLGTLGNNNPLIIIDGIESNSMDRIDPNDIESMSVLKDASAAIYGSRAANGVIILTTKRGTSGKPKFEYSGNIGFGRPTLKPNLASAYDYNKFLNAISKELNQPSISDADLEKMRTGADPDNNLANTDWWDAGVREFAPVNRQALSMRGGSEDLKYFLSLGYLDQQSSLKDGADKFTQYNYRANIDWQVNKYVKFGVNLSGRFEKSVAPISSMQDIWRNMRAQNPRYPVYYSNGLPWEGAEGARNPIIMATDAGGTNALRTNSYRNMATFEVKVPWVDGLSLDGYYSLENAYWGTRMQSYPWITYRKATDGTYTPIISATGAQYSMSQDSYWDTKATFNTKLNYFKKIGKHEVSAFIAYEQNQYDQSNMYAARDGVVSTDPNAQLFMGSLSGISGSGSAYKSARQNFFSRVSYNYSEKYLLDFTFRRDGSPIFPKDKRFGNFPGISAAWRISQEDFMKNNVPFIENLKLRASWGQLGNDRVGEYQYLTAYNYYDKGTNLYAFPAYDRQMVFGANNDLGAVLLPGVNANPNITWETADNKNIGVDIGLNNRLLEIEFDLFRNSRKNLLVQRNASIPNYLGITLPDENLGEMRNQGFEIVLTHNKKIADFGYSVSGNFSFNTNEVVYIDEKPNVKKWQKREGKPYGSELYYSTDGLYTQEDINNPDVVKYANAKAGDIKFIDYDNNKKIDADDKIRMDKSTDVPRIMYGFTMNTNYKGFDLNLVFQGAEKVYRYLTTGDFGIRGNFESDYYTNYWTAENPNARWPRANANSFGSSNNNDFFLLPAGYLRLRTAEFGYSIPERVIKSMGIGQLRFYFSGSNLLLLYNKLKLYDPEVSDGRGYYYPQQKIISFGINLTF